MYTEKSAKMIRTVLILSIVIAVASAFVAPAGHAAAPAFVAREAPKTNMMEIAETTQMIASSVTDNGGYLFPVFGLGALAAFILYLAPPLVDE